MSEEEKYIFDNIPEIDSVEKSLTELKNLNLENISVEDLKEKINTELPILTYTTVIWDSKYHIFRARRNKKNIFDKPYKKLRKIDIAPAKKTPAGRVNNDKEPVFYGAHEGDLCLFESCQKITEEEKFEPQNFTMGIWKVRENMTLRLIPIVDSDVVHQNREDIKKLSLRSDFTRSQNFETEKVRTYSKLILKFFADQFSKAEIKTPNDYKISAFFANFIKEINKISSDQFDGILYPSVAHKYRGENVAIFPESLHKLEPIKCFSVTAYNFDFDKGSLTKGIISEGKILENGNIIWEEK